MDESKDAGNLIRALIYGPPKSRKAWWALRMAELGFNVILADLDDGAGIAQVLDPSALKRIFRIDMRPNVDSYGTSGAAALSYAMGGQVVYFDEAERKYVPVQRIEPERDYVRIDLAKSTSRDVLVIDTWTAFVQQLTANTVMTKSPIAIEKLEWDEYQKVRLILDHFLVNAMKLNCHSIFVAHSETYAKKRPDADPKEKLHLQIESVRLQPSSITRAHAETMAAKFNEVLYFENHGSTLGVRISTKGTGDFDAGSRYFAPGEYKFDDFTADKMLTKEIVAEVRQNEEFSSAAITVVNGAEIIAERSSKVSPAPAIDVTGKQPITSAFRKK